jgi:hypothetical protein
MQRTGGEAHDAYSCQPCTVDPTQVRIPHRRDRPFRRIVITDSAPS